MLLASGDGNLYSLDAENGYAAKELCYTGDLFMSDMAYSPNLDPTLGTYGYYLMLVDPTTENGYRGLWNLQGAFTCLLYTSLTHGWNYALIMYERTEMRKQTAAWLKKIRKDIFQQAEIP